MEETEEVVEVVEVVVGSLQNCHVSLWLLIKSKDVDCFEQLAGEGRGGAGGGTSAGGGGGAEGIKAAEFRSATVGLMFMCWNIIGSFLPPPEKKARLCVGFPTFRSLV